MITKTNYIDYCKCPKLYYLRSNKVEPERITSMDEINLQNGLEVGQLARGYFGDYKLVSKDKTEKMVAETNEYINLGVETICEASAVYKDLFCSVDILHKNGDGYDIYEVKSTKELKDIHEDDVSFQYYVFTNAGYKIKKVYVLILNEDYLFKDNLEVQKYFKAVRITPKEITETELDRIRNLHKEGKTICCKECKECGYFAHCYKDLPADNIFTISSLRGASDYYNTGIITYDDLKPYLKPSKETGRKALEQIEYYQNDLGIKVKKEEVKNFLSTIKYPIYYLDFETIKDVIPFINDTHPNFDRIFQYSLHIQDSANSKLRHYEYLQENKYDNIDEVIDRLINDLGESGSIVVYSSFEETKIKSLIKLRPDKKKQLEAIISRLFDLEIPFKKRYIYCKEMVGHSSIKYVLPALCKDFEKAYSELPLVHKGDQAMLAYQQLISVGGKEHDEIKNALLEYCKLDTLAMVKVFERICELIA